MLSAPPSKGAAQDHRQRQEGLLPRLDSARSGPGGGLGWGGAEAGDQAHPPPRRRQRDFEGTGVVFRDRGSFRRLVLDLARLRDAS